MTLNTMTLNKETAYHNLPIEKDYGYAQAVKIGDTIYLSGQVSMNPKNQDEIIGANDIEAQIRQAYKNIQSVLAQYNATLENIVDETVFVTDADAFAAVAGPCRQAIFSGSPALASTVIQIQRLWLPELMIEIKCTAKMA